ncbi:MAG: EcsC family protein [Flavobacterium sp.]
MQQISKEDLILIFNAKNQLKNSNFLIQAFNLLGKPIESSIESIPEKQKKWLNETVQNVMLKVIEANLKTMSTTTTSTSNLLHKTIVTTSGIVGGFFGAAGFGTDLLISTKIIMRSILDIARSKGEDINDIQTQMACLEVFALGGKSKEDDATDTSYYTTRIALRNIINETIKHGSKSLSSSLIAKSSNPLMMLISKIAARYGVQVSEKFILEAIPVIGAVGGGTINYVFLQHYQKIAEAHFTIKALEKKYSFELVKETFYLNK